VKSSYYIIILYSFCIISLLTSAKEIILIRLCICLGLLLCLSASLWTRLGLLRKSWLNFREVFGSKQWCRRVWPVQWVQVRGGRGGPHISNLLRKKISLPDFWATQGSKHPRSAVPLGAKNSRLNFGGGLDYESDFCFFFSAHYFVIPVWVCEMALFYCYSIGVSTIVWWTWFPCCAGA